MMLGNIGFMYLWQQYWPWIHLGQYCCLRSIKLHIALITGSYLYNMKFDKVYNFNHPVLLKIYLSWFSHTCILVHVVFCIITYMGDSILKINFVSFLKMTARMVHEKYHNMASFPVWLQIQYGGMVVFLNRHHIFCEQLYLIFFRKMFMTSKNKFLWNNTNIFETYSFHFLGFH